MKKYIVAVLIAAMLLTGCIQWWSKTDQILVHPVKHLDTYHFNPDKALVDRIAIEEDQVSYFVRALDEKPDYELYVLNLDEKETVRQYLELLPPLTKKVLKERLLGIYFIKGFLGSGMCDWVIDDVTNFYINLFFNPDTLDQSLSERLNVRENSCFIESNSAMRIDIESGTNYTGFLYVLLHETTHAVDFVRMITPYVEPFLVYAKLIHPKSTPFVEGVWKQYNKPQTDVDKDYRDRLTFYGMSGGPKIPVAEAFGIYSTLTNTPFCSLYGSGNWAEDLADTVTFYTLTKMLKQPYRIRVVDGDKTVGVFEPMQSWKVRARFGNIQMFFEENEIGTN